MPGERETSRLSQLLDAIVHDGTRSALREMMRVPNGIVVPSAEVIAGYVVTLQDEVVNAKSATAAQERLLLELCLLAYPSGATDGSVARSYRMLVGFIERRRFGGSDRPNSPAVSAARATLKNLLQTHFQGGSRA